MKTYSKWFILFICTILSINLYAGDKSSFLKKQFTTKNGYKLNYRILYPLNYSSDKEYPLILFLHGAGERGNNNEAQLTHGGDMLSSYENQSKYPAIIIAPQCPNDETWAPITTCWNAFPQQASITPAMKAVKEMVDNYIAKGIVNTKRIYITGLSMGGMGSYDAVCRFPNFFAAATPICGAINTKRLESYKGKTAFSLYHGGADQVVNTQFSRDAYSILKEKNIEIRYKEYPGVDHGSWNNAFGEPDYLSWMFDHSL